MVKRLATEEDVYVLAQSDARIDKERGMRRYIERLKALQGQSLTRDQLLMKLGQPSTTPAVQRAS